MTAHLGRVEFFCEPCSSRDKVVAHSFNVLQAERIIHALQGILSDEVNQPALPARYAKPGCVKEILSSAGDVEQYLEYVDGGVEARGLTIAGSAEYWDAVTTPIETYSVMEVIKSPT